MSLPYCGFPRLSHQFPDVEVGVTFTVELVVTGGTVLVIAVVWVVGDEVAMGVDVEVVVFAQDGNTRAVMTRQVSKIQIIILFIHSPFF